ncbi:PREDICTED: putative methyltransferase NSUN6 isoform X1 [Thamnophis sirtalis]|uniref:Methyltransferase NSUN6 isoform X1 n=1 Tax=Thamnophis sirtalis TaxID=35019 RepID=A0A6I9XW68_9SAUR|nr:PREDICTED: putative methyltransferase NSUN6 isoform X1 [Thamnophis sirtalis]XP_013918006.1 PREDICTED: putative methyltransferase NSUN6 isoform X1 [Thamnophis sirtalis]
MSIFCKILLKPEVEEYLRATFKNDEITTCIGQLKAEEKYESLLNNLAHPPAFTSVRINTHLGSVEYVRHLLSKEIQKQYENLSVPVLQHPELPDMLLIPVLGPRKDLQRLPNEVIVDAQCGSAVLRGAHVYAPGIISASKFMKAGSMVSVYSDIEGKCKRGAKEFSGNKVFIGNGISELSRNEIFTSNGPLKGLGIKMTEPIYRSPSFDNMLSSYIFLQNLPSSIVSYVLNPQSGQRVLDMCAAPGGKTTHLATLMHDEGEVIALDKIADRVKKIEQNAALLNLNCIKAFCYDGTKALTDSKIENGQEGPPFLPESFDRILLDAPCSGMGQRPNLAYSWSLKEITSYQPLQRKLFRVAVQLLKPGGILVYSTCTITLSENEEQVAWALETFPCLQLKSQEPHVGGEGMMGAGLSPEQLKLLQRFDPSEIILQGIDCYSLQNVNFEDLIRLANKDCIGFFIAKFIKVQ